MAEDNQTIEFYDLKTRAKIQIPVAQVTKTSKDRPTKTGVQTRYFLQATAPEGTRLNKIVKKEVYDSFVGMTVV